MSSDLHPNMQVNEKDMFERLDQLERTVYVPNVSGEVADWIDAVERALKQVEDTTCGYYRTVHPVLFSQIAEHDPEQNPRVQALEVQDEAICDKLRAVIELAEKLRATGDCVEPDERRIANATQKLSDRAIAVVLQIRKHEMAISTWHMEALLRDRGSVD